MVILPQVEKVNVSVILHCPRVRVMSAQVKPVKSILSNPILNFSVNQSITLLSLTVC